MRRPWRLSEQPSSLHIFLLPDKRKSWLKVSLNGKRVTVADGKKVRDVLFEVVKNDVVDLKREVDYSRSEYALWKEIWDDKKPIPCFVFNKDVDGQ